MEKIKIDSSTDQIANTDFILFFSLFSGWQLSFPFLGQVLYCIYGRYSIDLGNLTLLIILTALLGLITAGYIINDIKRAKKAFLTITYISIVGSLVFFLPYSGLWNIVILILSFVGGVYIAICGYYYSLYSKESRIKAISKVLIFSNIIMIIINSISINISPFFGLGLSILSLILSLWFLNKYNNKIKEDKIKNDSSIMDNIKVIRFLYLFIYCNYYYNIWTYVYRNKRSI